MTNASTHPTVTLLPAASSSAARFSELDARTRVESFARLMDSKFEVPVLGWRVGLDAVVGLIPGVGAVVTAAGSTYLLEEARRARVPRGVMARMCGNILVDTGLSAIPLVGQIADVFFRANERNARLLLAHIPPADGVTRSAYERRTSMSEGKSTTTERGSGSLAKNLRLLAEEAIRWVDARATAARERMATDRERQERERTASAASARNARHH